MPELPEVETVCNALKNRAESKIIKEFKIYNPNLRWVINRKIPDKTANQKINLIKRRGKYIVFHLDNGYLIIHLGMTGIIKLLKMNVSTVKHDHFDININDKLLLRFNDVRKFGSVHWAESMNQHFLIKNLGPEPLSEDFSSEYLKEKSKKRKITIKDLIMNQQIVVGVGNIYATESLLLSKIRPNRRCYNLTKKEYDDLTKSIKRVLKKAIKAGGTSISDFKNLDGGVGYFSQKLKIYGLDECGICGEKTYNITIAGRSSYYCKKCQR